MGAGEGQLCRGLTDVRVAARHRLLQQRRATLAQLPQLSRATPPHKTSVPTKAAVSQSRNCFCAVCCSGQSTGGAAVTAAQASQRSRVQVRRVRGVRAAQAMMLCVPDRPPAGGAALPQPAAAASTPRQPHWRQHDDCRSHQQDTLTHQSSFFFRTPSAKPAFTSLSAGLAPFSTHTTHSPGTPQHPNPTPQTTHNSTTTHPPGSGSATPSHV
jgi:hypothetical protein